MVGFTGLGESPRIYAGVGALQRSGKSSTFIKRFRAFSLTVLTVEILSTWLFLNEKPHRLLPVCIDNERKYSSAGIEKSQPV